jgi:hypothetical protein
MNVRVANFNAERILERNFEASSTRAPQCTYRDPQERSEIRNRFASVTPTTSLIRPRRRADALTLLSITERSRVHSKGESAATDSRKAPKQFRPFPKSSSSGNQELYGQ